MLEALGIESVDALFDDIPASVRADGLDLPGPSRSSQLARPRWSAGRAQPGRTWRASWAPGVYRHHILRRPSTRSSRRGEFYTAYTPYQPEISQGTLQTIYEYQSLLAELTGLDVVSASHYDGAAATAEAALMTIRATRRDRVLASRAIHRHYLETTRDLLRRRPAACSRSCRRSTDGTTDLAALERGARRRSRPVAGVLARPAQRVRDPRADGRGGAPGPRRRRAVRGRRRAGLAGRPGAAGRVRRRHRRRRGPAAGHRAPVRRSVPGPPGRDRCARPADPRPAGRPDHRPRRPARVRHDAARARAGHPARQGGQQHLHQPGAVRAGGDGLPGHARTARPARRGGRRRGARPASWSAPWPARARRASTAARISTSSRSASPTRRGSTRRCSTGRPGRPAAGRLVPGRPRLARRVCWSAPRRSPPTTRSSGSPTRCGPRCGAAATPWSRRPDDAGATTCETETGPDARAARPPSARRSSRRWPSCRGRAAAAARCRIPRPTRSTASRPSTAVACPPALPELNEPEVIRHFVNLSHLNYSRRRRASTRSARAP